MEQLRTISFSTVRHIIVFTIIHYRRYMKFARVIEVDGERQICIRDKVHTLLDGMLLHNYFAGCWQPL